MVVENSLFIWPIIPVGLVLGLYELILIHRDENFRGSHWFGHGLHAVVLMWIGLFIVFNVEFFLDVSGLGAMDIPFITNPLVIQILVGLILNIKMHATSAVAKGKLAARGMAEHWTHTILISALVVAAPYIWPFVAPFVPAWIGGGA